MTLDAASTRRTSDGYLVAMPRVARVGIQEYRGFEVGRPTLDRVRVYRSEAEVFSTDALTSFAHRPVTIEHPPVAVTADNWKKYAVGQTGDEVARDGEAIRVPLVLMDKAAIDDVMAGKRELSMGYTTKLEWQPGTTEDGQSYDAIQTRIRGNHLAIVDTARGGPTLRIGDKPDGPLSASEIVAVLREAQDRGALAPRRELSDAAITEIAKGLSRMSTKTLTIDGVEIEIPDTAAAIVKRALKDAETKLADATREKDEAEKDGKEAKDAVAARDAEIATLKTQLDEARDPARIDQAVKDRALVIDKAKALMPKVTIDGKSDADVRRQVVDAKLGDTAKGWTDDQVAASFAALAASAPKPGNATARALGDAKPAGPSDAYANYVKRLTDAHRHPAGTA